MADQGFYSFPPDQGMSSYPILPARGRADWLELLVQILWELPCSAALIGKRQACGYGEIGAALIDRLCSRIAPQQGLASSQVRRP